ncbi:hypothetical protein AAFP35_15910 [Gordonia sp. CPCC 206044]|uniref:hypothetical protein n=1 Tax=Gordonia sp. CPCC 206044 TaxID=3140793 RepID=UPI003AF37EF5
MSAPIHPAPQPGVQTDRGERPKRPDAISIATELWVVVILGQIVALIGQYPALRDSWDRQVRSLPEDTPREEVDLLTSSGTLITVLALLGLALTAVSVMLVLLTRNGHNWARVIIAAVGVFLAVNLVFTLFGDVSPQWVMIPMVLSGVAAIGSSVLLLRRESEQYCRAMAEHRRRPRFPPGPPPGGPFPGPGSGYGPGNAPNWPYGVGQQSPPGAQGPDRTRPNEGNESRGES